MNAAEVDAGAGVTLHYTSHLKWSPLSAFSYVRSVIRPPSVLAEPFDTAASISHRRGE